MVKTNGWSKLMYFEKHLQNILKNNSEAFVQMPNDIFIKIKTMIKDECGKTNYKQLSFIYSYLVLISFLYKYSYYVDIENKSYIQTNDIKKILGYNENSRTINKFLKKEGILDNFELTKTSKVYPVATIRNNNEKINNIPLYEFVMNNEQSDEINEMFFKSIVKNRNYEVKVPLLLFDYNNDVGTLYNYENTHKIELKEFLYIFKDKMLQTTDFTLYMYFKSMCFGRINNSSKIAQSTIRNHLGIAINNFYIHLEVLENNDLMYSNRKGWQTKNSEYAESNEYIFKVLK